VTRYPVWLKGHSFGNTVRSCHLTNGRVGIFLGHTSFATIIDPTLGGFDFLVVTKDSDITLTGRPFGYAITPGAVGILSTGSSGGMVKLLGIFTSDEDMTGPPLHHYWLVNAVNFSIDQCSIYAALSTSGKLIRLTNCKAGVFSANQFWHAAGVPSIVRVDLDSAHGWNAPEMHFSAAGQRITPLAGAAAPFCDHPEFVDDVGGMSAQIAAMAIEIDNLQQVVAAGSAGTGGGQVVYIGGGFPRPVPRIQDA
jgi:hypothetical protein